MTKDLVGNEPFAVILSDDVIDATPPALKQMIDVYHRVDGPVLAVERVPVEDVSSYGVVAIEDNSDSVLVCTASRILSRNLVVRTRRPTLPSSAAIS